MLVVDIVIVVDSVVDIGSTTGRWGEECHGGACEGCGACGAIAVGSA